MRWSTFVAVLAALSLSSPLPTQSQVHVSDDFDQLLAAWEETPAGSPAESMAGEELRQWIEDELGTAAIESYGVYLSAEIGSAEESNALRTAIVEAMTTGDVREHRALDLLETYHRSLLAEEEARETGPEEDTAYTAAISSLTGPASPESFVAVGDVESVELSLLPLRIQPGSSVNMVGVLRNNSDHPVFLPERDAQLEVRPPVSNLVEPDAGSTEFIPALLPPNLRRIEHDGTSYVAVPPHTELRMVWDIPAPGGLIDRWVSAVLGPPPGEYDLNALVPYVFGVPRGQMRNRAASAGMLRIEATLAAMLPLAWLGGLVVLIFQVADFRRGRPVFEISPGGAFWGFLSMIAVIAIVLALSTALEGIEMLPHLSIGTRGAAVASGMLIQLLGFAYFRDRLPGLAPADGVAAGAGDGGEDGGLGGGGRGDEGAPGRGQPAEPAAADLVDRQTPAGGAE